MGVSEVCVMGLNENRGQRIRLRLRTDDLQGFRKILSIKKVCSSSRCYEGHFHLFFASYTYVLYVHLSYMNIYSHIYYYYYKRTSTTVRCYTTSWRIMSTRNTATSSTFSCAKSSERWISWTGPSQVSVSFPGAFSRSRRRVALMQTTLAKVTMISFDVEK